MAEATPSAPAAPAAPASLVRALVRLPERVARGEVFEVQLLLQHPMETGYRRGADGALLPRELIRRVECRLEGRQVFAADLHAAVAANPYLAFALRADTAGDLLVEWRGDGGFVHRERRRLELA